MAKQKKVRQEMWWVILAKSKTLRFFAVSCEFILFIGGLWITLTVNDPAAKTLLDGNINMVFLTIMGWAIDAAMPEAWLHVVIQHIEKRTGQLSWSKFVAICISILFIGNIIFSVMTSGNTTDQVGTPTDITGWVLLSLTILRITVGFVYLTVRQCQEWIDRSKTPEAQTPPALQSDSWPLVALAAQLQSDFQKQLMELASTQKTALAEFSEKQNHASNLQVQRLLSEVQQLQNDAPQPLDYDAVTQYVMTRLQAEFDARQKGKIEVIQEEVTHQIDAPKPRQKRVSAPKNDASQNASKKILTMRQPSASTTDKKERIHALLDEDMSLSSYRLAAIVGCSEPTARRIKNEWIDARHDASKTGEHDALETVVLTHDVARRDA